MEAKDITIRVQAAGGIIPFLEEVFGSMEAIEVSTNTDLLEIALYAGETSTDCERRETLGTIGSNVKDAIEISGPGFDILFSLIFKALGSYSEYTEYLAVLGLGEKIYLFKVDSEAGL